MLQKTFKSPTTRAKLNPNLLNIFFSKRAKQECGSNLRGYKKNEIHCNLAFFNGVQKMQTKRDQFLNYTLRKCILIIGLVCILFGKHFYIKFLGELGPCYRINKSLILIVHPNRTHLMPKR